MPHEIVPFGNVTDKEAMRQKILRIDSAGGGIYIYEALVAASKMILSAQAGTRHIILFSDASDAEQSPGYETIVAACRKAGITVSVVGLGTERDCDANLLKDIAKRGGGQCMFTNVAQNSRIFAQSTFMVARGACLGGTRSRAITGGLTAITQQPLGKFPHRVGYNLCYLRPDADLALVSVDEYRRPRCSPRGRPARAEYCAMRARPTGNTPAQLLAGRMPAISSRRSPVGPPGKSQGLGKDIVATQELQAGCAGLSCTWIRRRSDAARAPAGADHARGAAGRDRRAASTTRMNWSSADTLLAEVPLAGSETIFDHSGRRGNGTSHARPHVSALLAGVPTAQAGAGNRRHLERLGEIDRRL